MSLNFCELPEKFRGTVFMHKDDISAVPLLEFVSRTLKTAGPQALLEPFEVLHLSTSRARTLAGYVDENKRVNFLIHAVVKQLECSVEDVYVSFISAIKCESYTARADIKVNGKGIVVLALSDNFCIFASDVNTTDITILADAAPTDKSSALQTILSNRHGYHTYYEGSSPVTTFAEMLATETIERHNASIYRYLADTYECIAELHIPVDNISSNDMYTYFNSQIIYLLSKEYNCDFGRMFCSWVCESEDAVEYYYIKPFKNSTTDICIVEFDSDMIPVCDLGSQGCLIVSAEINLMCRDTATEVNENELPAFVGNQDDEHQLRGIPVQENGFALAVDKDSFVMMNLRHPTEADKSTLYKDLYLLRNVPQVPIWSKCTDKDHLYYIELNSFGVKSVKLSSTRVQRV